VTIIPHRKIENKDNKTARIFVSVLKLFTLSSQSIQIAIADRTPAQQLYDKANTGDFTEVIWTGQAFF
jgi:hypothetical protein